MDYISGGNLFDLCQNRGALGEDVGRLFLHQLTNAIEYMNKMNIVHRDIKLENILIDKQMNLVLADFGFATSG